MFKSTVNDRSEKFGLEKEISKPRAVYTDVGPLYVFLGRFLHRLNALCWCIVLLLFVVQQFGFCISIFGGHFSTVGWRLDEKDRSSLSLISHGVGQKLHSLEEVVVPLRFITKCWEDGQGIRTISIDENLPSTKLSEHSSKRQKRRSRQEACWEIEHAHDGGYNLAGVGLGKIGRLQQRVIF